MRCRAYDRANLSVGEPSLGFSRYRVLLRQRRLLADGVPIALGTRAFELLLVLVEANGSLVSKQQLHAPVWPGTVVAKENLKAQVFALRRALGEDHDFIRTEVGRGYRFIAAVRSSVPESKRQRVIQPRYWSNRRVFSQRTTRRPNSGWPIHATFRKSRGSFVKLPRYRDAAKSPNRASSH
jgi:DNA-binding winged helix-turn-helix (wHTH) protein